MHRCIKQSSWLYYIPVWRKWSRSTDKLCEPISTFCRIELFCLSKRCDRRFFRIEKFCQYHTSRIFKLYTDHQALKYAFNMIDSHERIAGRSTLLVGYDFKIYYRAGRDNAGAEYLSRLVELLVIDGNKPFEANLINCIICWPWMSQPQ